MSIPDQLKTIVVVMMENRSFDHVLGYLALPQFGGRTDVDGLLHSDTDPAFANEYDHQIYRPFPMSDGRLSSDLPHSRRRSIHTAGLSWKTRHDEWVCPGLCGGNP